MNRRSRLTTRLNEECRVGFNVDFFRIFICYDHVRPVFAVVFGRLKRTSIVAFWFVEQTAVPSMACPLLSYSLAGLL